MKDPMTDKQAAETVICWAIRAYATAVKRHATASAESEGNRAAERSWGEGGAMCSAPNPYTGDNERLARQEREALQEEMDRKQVRDFVIKRICNLVTVQE